MNRFADLRIRPKNRWITDFCDKLCRFVDLEKIADYRSAENFGPDSGLKFGL